MIESNLFIINNDYNSALLSFEEAFRNNRYIRSVDLVNASICATIVNNDSLAYKYLFLIAEKGSLNINIFTEPSSVFYKYKNDSIILNLTNINELNNYEIKRKNNYKYIQFLDSLDSLDQLYRKRIPKFNRKKRKIIINKIHTIDSLNILSLNTQIKKFGFPSNELIGVHPFYWTTIHHACGDSLFYYETLFNALKNGNLCSYAYIDAYNKYLKDFSGIDKYLVSNDTTGLSKEKISEINKNRISIGYPKIEESIYFDKYFENKIDNRYKFINPFIYL